VNNFWTNSSAFGDELEGVIGFFGFHGSQERRQAIPTFPNDSGCIIIVLSATGQDLR
jgi:hypothetical protein